MDDRMTFIANNKTIWTWRSLALVSYVTADYINIELIYKECKAWF